MCMCMCLAAVGKRGVEAIERLLLSTVCLHNAAYLKHALVRQDVLQPGAPRCVHRMIDLRDKDEGPQLAVGGAHSPWVVRARMRVRNCVRRYAPGKERRGGVDISARLAPRGCLRTLVVEPPCKGLGVRRHVRVVVLELVDQRHGHLHALLPIGGLGAGERVVAVDAVEGLVHAARWW